MRHSVLTTLTASTMLVAAVVGMPSSAQSQVVIIIGNGSALPYYSNPYPYRPQVYAEPTLYGDNGYYGYAASSYYQPSYGYYRPYRYGYYQPIDTGDTMDGDLSRNLNCETAGVPIPNASGLRSFHFGC